MSMGGGGGLLVECGQPARKDAFSARWYKIFDVVMIKTFASNAE